MNTEFAAAQSEPLSLDPLGILRADHLRIERCFRRYKEATNASQSASLIQDIVYAVTMHLEIEEAVFYPAYIPTIGDPARRRPWFGAHRAERRLLSDIEYADPGDVSLEYSLAELAERLSSHRREQEHECGAYCEIIRAGVDLDQLSRRLAHHRDNSIAGTMPSRHG